MAATLLLVTAVAAAVAIIVRQRKIRKEHRDMLELHWIPPLVPPHAPPTPKPRHWGLTFPLSRHLRFQ